MNFCNFAVSKQSMRYYFQIFWSFFKIGAFTLGGGYMMIPLIEQEIVGRRRWLSQADFTDTLTLAQSAPGPIAINTAVFTGYKMCGMRGVLASVSGVVLPSFAVILLIAMFFPSIRENEVIERIFKGIRPAVVALIAVSFVRLLQKKNFAWKVTLLASISALVVSLFKVSPIIVILIAGIGGIAYYLLRKKYV